MKQGKVIPLRANKNIAQTQYLLGESRNIASKFLPALLQRMLDNADDILFDLADKAKNDQDQNHYFDTMRELRIARKTLEGSFQSYLNTNFEKFRFSSSFIQKDKPKTELDSDEMSLVDEVDLEESLAITGMVAKSKSRYPREIYALEQRFQTIFDNTKLEIDQIPIGPKVICLAFDEGLKSLDCEVKVRLIIYKLFDKHVLGNLQPLYDEINVLFITAGILPKLKMRIQKKPANYHQQADTGEASWLEDNNIISPTQASLDSGAGYREPEQSGSVLNTLRSLLGKQDRGNVHDATQLSDSSDVIEILSSLQQLNVGASNEALRTEISTLKRNGKISVLDNDIINIVDMMFDYILDDINLPTIAKALLARLQIPMIKIALVDSDFFGNKQHPAKKLLNLMAKSTLGLGNDITADNCKSVEKIESLVNKICTDYISDSKIFEQLLNEFESFLQAYEEQAKKSQEQSKQRIQTREQHALSSAWVADILSVAINNRKIPKTVFELLDGPWKKVMLNTYLNDGDNSEHWKENLRFIDVLIWSSESNHSNSDRQRLVKIIPQLIDTFRQEIDSVYYPPAKTDELLANLKDIHISALRGEKNPEIKTVKIKANIDINNAELSSSKNIEQELDAMRKSLSETYDVDNLLDELLADINPDKTTSRKKAIASELFDENIEEIVLSSAFVNDKTLPEIDDKFWGMTLELKTGQWISLTDSRGKTQKIKLAWKSDMLGECTFINWRFKVAADFSFNQLASKFRSGQASVIDNIPVFERAVDAVVSTLQKNKPNSPTISL